jgi:hypothetical protein
MIFPCKSNICCYKCKSIISESFFHFGVPFAFYTIKKNLSPSLETTSDPHFNAATTDNILSLALPLRSQTREKD